MMIYIGYEEEWKIIDYKDIKRDTYEVSNLGNFRKITNKMILKGNNPKNERNYHRIALLNTDNKVKKYAKHRIVLYTFGNLKDDEEVNHINGNKNDNSIYNLEAVNRKENAEHASINRLYKSCEDHYSAIFTNKTVNKICFLLESGYSINDIIKKLKLEKYKYAKNNISKIANRKTWKNISSKYNIDFNKYHYKTYSYEDINTMSHMMFVDKMSYSEIISNFPKYNSKKLKIMLKSLKHGRIYKQISIKYQGSTTIESIAKKKDLSEEASRVG